MPAAPPCLTLKPLSHAGVPAALAGDDLAGEDPGRCRGVAQRPAVRRGRGQHQRRAVRRRAVIEAPSTSEGSRRRWRRRSASVANSRVCVEAATVIVHGDRWFAVPAPGPSLPAEVDDQHAGGVRVEEGQLDRVGERVGAAGDREVDDVDAVEDRLRRPRRRSRSRSSPRCRRPCTTSPRRRARCRGSGAAVDAEDRHRVPRSCRPTSSWCGCRGRSSRGRCRNGSAAARAGLDR